LGRIFVDDRVQIDRRSLRAVIRQTYSRQPAFMQVTESDS
jgi:hypothetical protein